MRVHNVYSVDPDNAHTGFVYWHDLYPAWEKYIVDLTEQTSVNIIHVENTYSLASLLWTPDVAGNHSHLFLRVWDCAASVKLLKKQLGKEKLHVRTLTLELDFLPTDFAQVLPTNMAAIQETIEQSKQHLHSVFVYVRGHVSDFDTTANPFLFPFFLAIAQAVPAQRRYKVCVVIGDTLKDFSWEHLVDSWRRCNRKFRGFRVLHEGPDLKVDNYFR